jgi:hypothetical protein
VLFGITVHLSPDPWTTEHVSAARELLVALQKVLLEPLPSADCAEHQLVPVPFAGCSDEHVECPPLPPYETEHVASCGPCSPLIENDEHLSLTELSDTEQTRV